MATARKLTKVGNSYAAIIPRQIMAVLGMDGTTPVVYETDGETLVIRPVPKRRVDRKRRIAKAIDRVFERYPKTMLRLAGK